MTSFFGLSRTDLLQWVQLPARASHVFSGVYRQGPGSFNDIPMVPAAVRRMLDESLSLDLPRIQDRYASADGTQRCLLQTVDGETVEAVRIPGAGRDTFCLSSQVGCALGCTFCLTGQLGLVRDLSAAEIVAQAVLFQRESPGRFSIVLMGMGEPLQNYDNVMQAIRILHDDCGLAVPAARITLSTAGLVPGIRRLARETVFPNLSISITGVTNEKRNDLMPINRRYPIEEVIEAVRELPLGRRNRVMFECVMIDGLTDSPEDAERLSMLLSGTRAKVNLIPLNPAPEIPFARSNDRAVFRFQEILLRNGVTTFIRRNRGNDVSGACGQLKRKVLAR